MIELTLGSIFLSFVATVVVAILLSRPPRGVDVAVSGWPEIAARNGWSCRTPAGSHLLRWSPELVVDRGAVTVTVDTVALPSGVRTRARATGPGSPNRPEAALPGAVSRAHHGVAELVWAGVETDEARLIAAIAAVSAAWGLAAPA